MERIKALRLILIKSLTAQDGEQELFDELTVQRPRLLNVFEFGKRSPQELKELESGKIQVDGRTLAVNAEFARQAAFISQQIDLSERACAGLLQAVLAEHPNIGHVQAVEKAVLDYHQARRDLSDCIGFIFEASGAAQQGIAGRLHAQVDQYARRHLIGNGGGGSLAHQVFVEISNLGDAIAKAKIAVTNAVSDTNIPDAPGGKSNLGHGVLTARLESLMYERRTLSFALFLIARAGYLTSSEIRPMIEWLDGNTLSDTTYYILASLLAAFDLSHSPSGSPDAELREALVKDASTLSFIKKKLAPTTDWKDASLKATIQLKWALFLTEARLRDHTLEHRDGFKNEDLEMQVLNAVQGDAFSFLTRIVTQLGVRPSATTQLLGGSTALAPIDSTEPRSSHTEDFKLHLLHEFELLLRSLLTHAPAELRKIKHKQEDQFRPRSDRHRSSLWLSSEATADKPSAPPRSDIATLFQLIGTLYAALPVDSAIQFWGGVPSTERPAHYELVEADRGKLPSFLRWAVEVREQDLIISVFDMLVGLATGQACSECAYNFMATGSLDVVHGAVGRFETGTAFTWGSIFGELESWAALGNNQRGGHVGPQQLPIAPKDVLLGLSFLKLLASVVTHSVQARIAIFSHPQYRAIGSLVSLIPLGVPLELKGALFETLSAFCQPGAGLQGVDICKSVWAQMERLEVINVRGAGISSKGVEVELEEIESAYKVYPATLPFLELLGTLIHTPKRVPLKNRILEPAPINTIPESLGQPYRSPGIGPFVSFVVDNVLDKRHCREFLDPADSWRMSDGSLCFLERCLASYDLESISTLSDEYATKGPDVLLPLLQHPGFDVLTRILTDTPLRSTIIAYVVEGPEELYRQNGKGAHFPRVLVRALRIVDRVLAIQDIFLDQLVPVLSEFDSSSVLGKPISHSFFARLDQGLSFDQRSIPAIASIVNFPAYPEMIYLAVKILTLLAQSSSFSNIAGLIERSPESSVILDGFVRLLGVESNEDVATAEEWADYWVGAGAPDFEDTGNFTQVIRLAILDLLLRGTKNNRPSSLAFILLFGTSVVTEQIQDPHALGARQTCLHVVLQLLSAGILRHDQELDHGQRAVQFPPLFISQPVLAERLYKLVYQLCTHTRTSSAMILYLRTREDFFARHLSAMSFHAPADARSPIIEVVYGDGSRITTTCGTLKAFLQSRSWLLELIALELHVLTSKGQHQRVKGLLNLLFSSTDVYHDIDADFNQDIFQPFHDVSQSHIRIIEIFQSLEFEWFDSVSVTPVNLEFYKQLNLQSCVRMDDMGCEVVDRSSLFQLLNTARRMLLTQGHVVTAAHNQQLDAETKYVLESCVVENNRREVQFALATGYESWKRLLDVVLTKCFNRIEHDQRETILFDLLHVLPPSICAATLPESSATLLSEALLLLITKLREERRQLHLLSSGQAQESSALPTERMYGLLRSIMECILDNRRKELVRGNLYATLINFLHLVSGPTKESPVLPTEYTRELTRLSSFASVNDSLASSVSSLAVSTRRSPAPSTSLEAGSLSIIQPLIDRLIMTVSRDAIDGTEVWKTVAFTLLDSLTRLARLSKRHLVLASLEKYGLLSNFVRGLKDADSDIQGILRPDPDDLNPLYVYEAKMSFLIRLAQSRQGAERLLETRMISILAQVDFLDARPEADESFVDCDNFLPSAINRYHQLLVPALQLVEGILATLGTRHIVASKQTLDFLENHRDTLVILLKNDSAQLSLANLEEFDLIVSLCGAIVPSVPKTDLFAVNTGFGGLHSAILALSARYLGTRHWKRTVQPSTESELLEADSRARGHGGNASKFDVRVHEAGQKFRKSVLEYLSAASDFGESDLTIVLSPVTTIRKDDRAHGITVPLPSLSDAIEALADFCEDLQNALQQIADISAELEHREHIRIDNIEEMTDTLDPESLRRLDMGQRRTLVGHLLEQSRGQYRERAESLLCTMEMLLLLIWRHVAYYAAGRSDGDQHAAGKFGKGSAQFTPQLARSSTTRFLVLPNAESFQRDAALALGRVMERIEAIELNEELAGRDWRANKSYIEIMCRRMREAVSIDISPTENDWS